MDIEEIDDLIDYCENENNVSREVAQGIVEAAMEHSPLSDKETIEQAIKQQDYTYIVASDSEELGKEFCEQCGFNIGTHEKPMVIADGKSIYVDYEKIGNSLEHDYTLYNDCVYIRFD